MGNLSGKLSPRSRWVEAALDRLTLACRLHLLDGKLAGRGDTDDDVQRFREETALRKLLDVEIIEGTFHVVLGRDKDLCSDINGVDGRLHALGQVAINSDPGTEQRQGGHSLEQEAAFAR